MAAVPVLVALVCAVLAAPTTAVPAPSSAFGGVQAAATAFDLAVNSDGTFDVKLNGKVWLQGGEVQVAGLSAKDGSLKLLKSASAGGTDPLGDWTGTTQSWGKAGTSDVLMDTTFRTYKADPGMIVFEQYFPTTLTDEQQADFASPDSKAQCRIVTTDFSLTSSTSGYNAFVPSGGSYAEHADEYCNSDHHWSFLSSKLNETACAARCTAMKCKCFDFKEQESTSAAKTIFPGFQRNTGPSDDLPCFSYHGTFPALYSEKVSEYTESHQGGAPLTIWDPSHPELPMVVFSPLNFPKAHHMATSHDFFGAGVKSTVTTIPAGWSQLFLLSAGSGINDGMMAWGDRMLKFTGKPRADPYLDQTSSTIGFWTDNGGFYHYSIGSNKSLGSNYEEVLPKVKAYHDEIQVPFGHWQFDSWFYPKDGGVGPGGGGGSVTNWTAMPSIFPHGMAFIQSKLQVPMVMHNRQWSDKSDYIKNEPFKWYESKYAVPEDPVAFFDWFFKQQEGWGLKMYEQDWMCTEYDGVSYLQSNISLGDLWLYGMAHGAASSNRSVQYCMPYAHDLLSASAYPAVTNARATGDYFHALDQWSIAKTSLFYWAIGIIPFKDGFYSSTHKQIGGQTVGPELNPDREAFMATMSTGMVGPMDGIYLLNKTRVMQTCNAAGHVLRPDKPISVPDDCFRGSSNPADCSLSTTHSDLSYVASTGGSATPVRFHFLFNNHNKPLTPNMVNLNASSPYVLYNWYTKKVFTTLDSSMPLEAGYEGHVYGVFAPKLGGNWAYLGEVAKFTVAASRRTSKLQLESSGALTAELQGSAGETTSVCAVHYDSGKIDCQQVTFTSATAQATFTN